MIKDRIEIPFDIEILKEEDRYIGWFKEHPHIISQGETLKDLRYNLEDAFKEILKIYKKEIVVTQAILNR